MRGRTSKKKIEKVRDECLFDARCGSGTKILQGTVVEFQVEHEGVASLLYAGVSPNLLIDWLSNVDAHCPLGDFLRLLLIKRLSLG
jgi:hypothetical protein